jgi:hypothetical protein
MKKRLVSIILTVFLVLSMMPFAAFADNAIVCPACGGEVTKKQYHLVGNYWDFYKCNTCGKWAYLSGVAGLKLLSAGDQAIINAADANAILNFSFNNGQLIPAEKAPSGIGRKDLPGYADDNGTPIYNVSGKLQLVIEPYGLCEDYATSGKFIKTPSLTSFVRGSGGSGMSYPSDVETVIYSFVAPCDGVYYASSLASPYDYGYISIFDNNDWHEKKLIRYTDKVYFTSITLKAGETCYYLDLTGFYHYVGSSKYWPSGKPYRYKLNPVTIFVDPVGESSVTNNNTITINNNTWNGNIYTDNSTNLTYIYPQYTTINEKNETVTNISTNPIIYNNETKQYYTYDQTTKNYYYITYNAPSPSPTPAPTWTPGGGATRGGGVGRHPSDTDAADWTLHYYVLNNRRYDAYYALKKTEVDTDTKLPWVDNKKYISTTQIPIANGQYTVSVPDGVYWRVWSWDEASQTLTGVNSSNWHSTINNFLFNATGEYIFEFCKADGSDFDTAKDVTLKLKNDKITKYEDGGTIVEEPTPSPSPEPTETPSPTEPPTHTATPNPGGGTVPTPGGDSGGGNSGSSDSGWNPFKWLTDLLKDIVETILKGLWKLLTSIFGFILWLLSLLFKLFPWMPNSGILALCAGVVVVTVIRIIKFITGR